MKHWARLGFVALGTAALAGCSLGTVQGRVVDMNDEALPGVAVNVLETAYQDVTDSRGEYRVRYEPGEIRLRFSKTGYTPAAFATESEYPRPIYAETVRMWRLPPNRGVYIFDGARYHDTDAVEPAAYGSVHGTEKWVEARAPDPNPWLIAYKMPEGGAQLVRLEFVEATRTTAEGEPGEAVEVWAASGAVPVESKPLDEPEHLLRELSYEGPLEPGVYAVHWGALDGTPSPEPQIFMFRVGASAPDATAPDEAEAEPEEEGAEPEADAEADGDDSGG